ncbi:MAG: calcium/sodium antiporter [Trueperaceae bacterium]|nr:calcium/sodium antiporter [Trueperaceae bacterium]
MTAWLAVLGGLGVLVLGADVLVRGGSRLATRLGIRPMVIGLTVVAVGTSIPELAVGFEAVRRGAGALAIGNIAGTNIVNMLLILGLVALIRPLEIHRQTLRFELPVMVVAAGLLLVLALDGGLSKLEGLVLVAYGALYTFAVARMSLREGASEARVRERPVLRVQDLAVDVGLLGIGIALTIFGADWLVDGSVGLARSFGVSDAVIGLTIVAVGTSAPELVTAIVSSIKGERDIAVGNLIGSNVYNVALILGATVLAAPGTVPVISDLVRIDLPVMFLVMLACVPVFVSRGRVSRLEGGIFVSAYVLYIAALVVFRT